MRHKLIRLLILIVACSSSWFVTSTLMAQQSGKRIANRSTPAVALPSTTGKTFTTKSHGEPIAARASIPADAIVMPATPPVAAFRLTGYEQVLTGNQVKIRASADIIDQRDGIAYLWVLKVSADGGGTAAGYPILKNIYDHQVFDVAQTRQGTPTFSETIQLPKGSHFVELGLYFFRKDEDLSFLSDVQAAKAHLLLGGGGPLVIR